MTHELKIILDHFGKRQNERSVLATVVALDGSSYRRPGVRMLIFENGDMVELLVVAVLRKKCCDKLNPFLMMEPQK